MVDVESCSLLFPTCFMNGKKKRDVPSRDHVAFSEGRRGGGRVEKMNESAGV